MLKTTEEGRWRLAETKKRLDKWTVERYEKEHAQAEGEEHVGPQADPGADHGADPGAGADGEGDQREDIPFEDFQRDADADAEPREDVEMDMAMKDVSEDERKIIKAKDHEIMEIVRQLGGEDRAYRRERRTALEPMLAETYRVPRVTAAARLLPSMGIIPGFALDLTTTDEHGVPWDFDVADRRAEARRKVETERPMFLIGSPMCTAFSTWQALIEQNRDPDVVRREYTRAMVHLRFICEIYALQTECGRYFVHEHPACARSWGEECIQDLLRREGVGRTIIDQGQYGQQAPSGDPVKKPTTLMSNSPEILRAMTRRCTGRGGRCSRPRGGSHALASGKSSRLSAIYPSRCAEQCWWDAETNYAKMEGYSREWLVSSTPRLRWAMKDYDDGVNDSG